VSKRLASLLLAYGVVGALFAPAGLVAQEQPATETQPQPQAPATTTTTEAPPTQTQAQPMPPPPQPAATNPATQPAPAAPAPEPPPVVVASGAGSVTMKNIAFSPASVTVIVGDSVTWTIADEVAHNVTANDGSFQTGNLKRGASGSHTFTKAGSFGYVCTIHPGMNGSVKVEAASSGGGGNSGSGSNGSQSGSGSGAGTSSGSSSGSAAAAGSGASLPATGVDAGGLALWGAGFLLIGLLARRRALP
jgi:plastocyanin